MQSLNSIMIQFPKQQLWKEYACENNTKEKKVWENVAQTMLGCEFLACYVVAHKACS